MLSKYYTFTYIPEAAQSSCRDVARAREHTYGRMALAAHYIYVCAGVGGYMYKSNDLCPFSHARVR